MICPECKKEMHMYGKDTYATKIKQCSDNIRVIYRGVERIYQCYDCNLEVVEFERQKNGGKS